VDLEKQSGLPRFPRRMRWSTHSLLGNPTYSKKRFFFLNLRLRDSAGFWPASPFTRNRFSC